MKLKAPRKILTAALAALLLAVYFLSGLSAPAYAAAAPYTKHGALHVKGVNLTDSHR
jgi:hypothetical protein